MSRDNLIKGKKGELNTENLLIFGYSCKLFRDDEKALFIDQGKHLIPWMGDETLKIDRYDGRGALHDIKQHEPIPGGYDSMMSLTNEERRIEQMCDEERYYSLNTDEDIDLLYQEEELKRLQEAGKEKMYGQVGFTYDDDNSNSQMGLEETPAEEEDDPDDEFISIPQLDIPVNTVMPTSKKHFAIIEKTAGFINSQGAQMEILLKMKQAGNPHFGFLSFDNPLYPFYRHVLSAIQSGRYIPGSHEKSVQSDLNSSAEPEEYLHPSLQMPRDLPSAAPDLGPSVPSISYKPSENCAYSMLINKIKAKQFAVLPNIAGHSHLSTSNSQSPASTGSDSPVQSEAASKPSGPIYISKSAVISGNPEYYNPEEALDTEEEDDGQNVDVEVPEAELKLVIDRLVVYVAKNGRDFELIVRQRCDPRFSFLDKGDKYNPYYEKELVKKMVSNKNQPLVSSVEPMPTDEDPTEEDIDGVEINDQAEENVEDDIEAGQKQNLLRFSIKPKSSDVKDKVKSALPAEESDREDDDVDNNVPSPPPPPAYDANILASSKAGLRSPPPAPSYGASPPPAPVIGSLDDIDPVERQRQAERKKKAEMFLKMLQEKALNGNGKTFSLSTTSNNAKANESNNTNKFSKLNPLNPLAKKIPIITLKDTPPAKPSASANGSSGVSQLKEKLKALRKRSSSPLQLKSKTVKMEKSQRRRSRSRSSSRDRRSKSKHSNYNRDSRSKSRYSRSRSQSIKPQINVRELCLKAKAKDRESSTESSSAASFSKYRLSSTSKSRSKSPKDKNKHSKSHKRSRSLSSDNSKLKRSKHSRKRTRSPSRETDKDYSKSHKSSRSKSGKHSRRKSSSISSEDDTRRHRRSKSKSRSPSKHKRKHKKDTKSRDHRRKSSSSQSRSPSKSRHHHHHHKSKKSKHRRRDSSDSD